VTPLRPLIAVCLASFAVSCASDEGMRLSEEPSFQAGYGDGCVTANEQDKSFSTKRARDEYLFESDRAYRAGWRQGYLQCGGERHDESDGGLILGEEGEN
jgi:hypothetical protein